CVYWSGDPPVRHSFPTRRSSDLEVVAECDGGAAAVDATLAHAPDLLFLDVEMPGLDGFATLARLGATPLPAVVFVTAYDEYALRDRKSTRLNSSHSQISYAVFCL